MIKPTDVGKRVSVQYYDDDGARTEAVGTLERVEIVEGEPVLHIRKRDDSLVGVPMRRVRFGKVIAPSRRKPW